MVHEAESSKARMLATKGKDKSIFMLQGVNDFNPLELSLGHDRTDRQQATVVDENYMVVGAHLDDSIHRKIANHEYVDFLHLLPKDKIMLEEDHRIEIMNRGGSTYFVPVSDRESAGSISSFMKWEQAFRVFSNLHKNLSNQGFGADSIQPYNSHCITVLYMGECVSV